MKQYNPHKYLSEDFDVQTIASAFPTNDLSSEELAKLKSFLRLPKLTDKEFNLIADKFQAYLYQNMRCKDIALELGITHSREFHDFVMELKKKVEKLEESYLQELTEGFFSVNNKKFVKELNNMMQHYKKYYNMITLHQQRPNVLEIRILHYNNHVGKLVLDIEDEENAKVIANIDNVPVIHFKRGQEHSFKDILKNIKLACEFNWRSVFNSPHADMNKTFNKVAFA